MEKLQMRDRLISASTNNANKSGKVVFEFQRG